MIRVLLPSLADTQAGKITAWLGEKNKMLPGQCYAKKSPALFPSFVQSESTTANKPADSRQRSLAPSFPDHCLTPGPLCHTLNSALSSYTTKASTGLSLQNLTAGQFLCIHKP